MGRGKSKLFCVLFFLSYSCYSVTAQCSYETCPETDPNVLNVHLVAHSHDDVGWLKTVDQYYQGSNRKGWVGWEENQKAGVQYTIDTVVQELAMDPEKRYIQVETAFFWRWWKQQDEDTKDTVKALVNQGQLEFIGGGWSMNDEGASHYAALVDQMSLGLRILNDTFGTCGVPKVAWQIDPFGHSKEQANLFANMGFDGLFFARLDWRDKTQREHNKTMEMVWEASQDLGEQSDLFTGVLFDHYGPPPGFCWDLLCNDQPIMDNVLLENNLQSRMTDFVDYVRNQAKYYKTNNIMLTMGMDFHYQAAHAWFMNLDRLIKHVPEQDPGINIFYSTPSCYLKALHSSAQVWPTKQDDFFPYASDPHAYWSGYFSSRPTSKFMIRQTERMAKIISQLSVISDKAQEDVEKLNVIYETVGIVQHHDAVTGTEKQHVADDYHTRMHHALETGAAVVNLTPVYNIQIDAGLTICPMLNISQCPTTENFDTNLKVNIYNPLARVRSYIVRLPVTYASYQVTSELGDLLNSQLVQIPAQVLTIPGRESMATHELVFPTTTDPLSISKYSIQKQLNDSGSGKQESLKDNKTKKFEAGKNSLKMYVQHKNPTLYFKDEDRNIELEVKMELMYYKGHRGNNSEFEFRASGAYIFRPDGDQAISFGDPTDTIVSEGAIVDEIHRTYAENWVTQIIRLYHEENLVEVEWVVGPIPVADGVGKEVIARYTTSIDNKGIFYTDSNGRQMMERELNYRPTYEINITEPVAQNYYPVNAKILIKDQENQLAILTDRSQGGGSIIDGSIELMVHRRLLDDDAFGVGEALNEVAFEKGLVATGKHVILFDNNEEQIVRNHRLQAMDIFYQPLEMFGEITSLDFPSLPSLTQPLPDNVHILTLKKIFVEDDPFGDFIFLQLEHIFQAEEHSQLSQSVTISLSNLFSFLSVEWARETTLAGNIWKDESERLVFEKDSNKIPQTMEVSANSFGSDWEVKLNPMDIKSFVMKIVYNN